MVRYVSVLSVKQQDLFFVLTENRMDMEMDDCPKKNTDFTLSSRILLNFIYF